jgi:hypothetical protein
LCSCQLSQRTVTASARRERAPPPGKMRQLKHHEKKLLKKVE